MNNQPKSRLAIIGTVGVPAKYGGFETLVEQIQEPLCSTFNVSIYCQKSAYSKRPKTYKNAQLHYINLKANGLQSIFYDIYSILHAFKKTDIYLILGVSGAIILPFVKLFSNKKIVTNIDGLEWKREKWNKPAKLFLKFSEYIAVKFSNTIIADNLHIQNHIKNQYNKNSVLIPYGGDHVSKEADAHLPTFGLAKNNYLFTVCRIEPENNIQLLLEAFQESTLNIPYVLVGNWQNSPYGKQLFDLYKNSARIKLINPIYDAEKLNSLRSNCTAYLHGHSAGGTNPSLVEAMSLSLPLVVYGVNYNRATTQNKSLYFTDKPELLTILNTLSQYNLKEQGATMKKIAAENYTWNKISQQYDLALKTS
jgi:glycosyltransferase involved in cell wall biosynthesis